MMLALAMIPFFRFLQRWCVAEWDASHPMPTLHKILTGHEVLYQGWQRCRWMVVQAHTGVPNLWDRTMRLCISCGVDSDQCHADQCLMIHAQRNEALNSRNLGVVSSLDWWHHQWHDYRHQRHWYKYLLSWKSSGISFELVTSSFSLGWHVSLRQMLLLSCQLVWKDGKVHMVDPPGSEISLPRDD